jgi:hypothetical protein
VVNLKAGPRHRTAVHGEVEHRLVRRGLLEVKEGKRRRHG